MICVADTPRGTVTANVGAIASAEELILRAASLIGARPSSVTCPSRAECTARVDGAVVRVKCKCSDSCTECTGTASIGPIVVRFTCLEPQLRILYYVGAARPGSAGAAAAAAVAALALLALLLHHR